MIQNFLSESQTFDGIMFHGSYCMPLKHFESLFNYWQFTGCNYLDDYTEIVGFVMEAQFDNQFEIDYVEYDRMIASLETVSSIVNMSDSDYRRAKFEIERQHNRFLSHFGKIELRNAASAHTSNPKVRAAVFEKYGNICLACGSAENIQIDHVLPVSKGGLNVIENYQPLCRSCNAKKSDKVIDYRISKQEG